MKKRVIRKLALSKETLLNLPNRETLNETLKMIAAGSPDNPNAHRTDASVCLATC